MDSVSSGFSNPWSTQDSQHQALSGVLRLASVNGYQSFSTVDGDDLLRQQMETQSPSLQLIQRLREKSEKTKELTKVRCSIQKRLMDKETQDIIHSDALESKITMLRDLNDHLEVLLQRKADLTMRLQQPVIGDNIRVEAAYHDHIRELFPMVAAHLAHLNKNLDGIQWSSDFKQTGEHLGGTLDDMTRKVAQMQMGFNGISQFRSALQHL